MTTTEAALRDALERWPGYTEQSWPERFAELDRRHAELKTRMYQEITRHGGISKDVSQPSPASSTAQEVLLTCLCGTVNKRTLPYDMNKPDSCDHCDCANFGHYSTISLSPPGEPASVAMAAKRAAPMTDSLEPEDT